MSKLFIGLITIWILLLCNTNLLAQPQMVLQNGHSGEVVQSVYSPSGKYLYTVGEDGSILCWDLNTSRHMVPIYGMLGHEKAYKMYFANKTEFLVLTNGNNIYFGTEGVSQIKPYSGYHFSLYKTEACKSKSDGFFIAVALDNEEAGKIAFYYPLNKRDKRTQFVVGDKDIIKADITRMHFEPTNRNLFLGDELGNLYCVNADTREIKLIRKFKKTEISQLHSSPESIVVETRSLKGKRRILYWINWNQTEYKAGKPKVMDDSSRLQSICYVPWRQEYATIEAMGNGFIPGLGYSGSAEAYKTKYYLWTGEHNKPINHLTGSDDGKYLALFPFNGGYHIYNSYENSVVQNLHKPALEFSDFRWDTDRKIMYTFSSSKRLCTKIDMEHDLFTSFQLPFRRESTHHFMADGQFVVTDNMANTLYSFKPDGTCDSIKSPLSMFWEFHANDKYNQIIGYGKKGGFMALNASTLQTQFEVPFKLSTMMGQFGITGDGSQFWYYNIDFENGDTVYFHKAENGQQTLKVVKEDLLHDSFGIELSFDVVDNGKLMLVSTSALNLAEEGKTYRLVVMDLTRNMQIIQVIYLNGEVKKFIPGRNSGEVGLHLKNYKGEYTVGFFKFPEFKVESLSVNLGEKIEALQWEGENRFWLFSNVQSHVYKGQSGELKMFNLETGGVDYDLVTNENGYALVSNNEEMLCTKGSSDLVAFQSTHEGETRLVPGSEYEVLYNKPHSVLRNLNCKNNVMVSAYEQAYNKRVTRMGIGEGASDSVALPFCQVGVIDGSLVTSTVYQTLSIRYNSTVPIKNLVVEQNGSPNSSPQGYKIHPDSALDGIYKAPIALVPGINRFSFYVIDSLGRRSIPDYKEIFLVNFYPAPVLYYIGIGVSQYQDSNFNLHYAAKDIRDLSQWMQSRPNAIIDTFVDGNALWDSMQRVKKTLNSLKPWDKVVVSFSGHGMLAKDLEFYLAMYNMDFVHPEKTGLKLDSLLSLLDHTQALQKLVLLDACHSGEIDKEGKVISISDSLAKDARGSNIVINKKPQTIDAFEFMKSHFEDAASANGVVVISAAGGEEYALELQQLQNGVFTYALLQCLTGQGSSLSSDGVTVSDLKNYLIKTVPELTLNRQKPTIRKENAQNDWRL